MLSFLTSDLLHKFSRTNLIWPHMASSHIGLKYLSVTSYFAQITKKVMFEQRLILSNCSEPLKMADGSAPGLASHCIFALIHSLLPDYRVSRLLTESLANNDDLIKNSSRPTTTLAQSFLWLSGGLIQIYLTSSILKLPLHLL